MPSNSTEPVPDHYVDAFYNCVDVPYGHQQSFMKAVKIGNFFQSTAMLIHVRYEFQALQLQLWLYLRVSRPAKYLRYDCICQFWC